MLLLLLTLHISSAEQLSPVVRISSGLVRGHEIQNPVSKYGNVYFAFQGIPYAKPPVDELRFQPPVEPDKWEGIRDTTQDASSCVKSSGGSEDCLYLNVFTTNLPDEHHSLLMPVMVYIHGGAFIFGDAPFNMTRPDYLIEEGVVVVTIQYRLNVFGFLNTLDNASYGNAGLKDQVAALRWVNRNIRSFGGDSNKVTIFGQSAGGASVQYLVLSPLAKGLFHRAIAESGSSLNRWAFQHRNPRELAFKLGAACGIITNDTIELIQKLQGKDHWTLLKASVSESMGEYSPISAQPFEPSVEINHDNAFMAMNSYEAMKKGLYIDVPYLTGYNEHEGNYALWYVSLGQLNLTTFEEDHELLVPEAMNLVKGTTDSKIVAQKIISRYFNNDTANNSEYFENYMSEELFTRGIRKSVHFMKNRTDVYFYKFTYVGSNEQEGFWPVRGHGAELPYIFYVNANQSAEDALVRQRMVRLWTNFAKTGNPTPEKDSLLQNVIWKKANTVAGYGTAYLQIGENLESGENVDQTSYNFWEWLFEKYGKPPYYLW